MNQNKLLPFELCCIGCKRCCYHCTLGCQTFCQSFKECMFPCCIKTAQLIKENCKKININCSCCSICYQSCCIDTCNCKFRYTNPFLIQDQISQELFEILQNYDYMGEQDMFCYGKVYILQENILYPSDQQHSIKIIVEQIIDYTNKQDAKKLAQTWFPRLQQRFPHILQLQQLLQRQIDGFFSKQYRTYLFFDYILDSFQQEFEHRQKISNYFTQKEILSYFLGVLSGILYLQSQKINPSFINLNEVYLTEVGTIKLLDPSFYSSTPPFQQVANQMQQKNRIQNKVLKRFQNISYYLAPEQLQEIHQGNDTSRPNSCLFTLAIKTFELATMKSFDFCYKDYQIDKEILQQTISDAQNYESEISIDFMMLLEKCLEFDPDQRISLEQIFQHFIKLPDVQLLILEMPKDFAQAYNQLLIQQNYQQQNLIHPIQQDNLSQLPFQQQQYPQQQQQFPQQQQQQQQKNLFDEILKSKNYQIGQKQENAFTKLLKEKNYQLGAPSKRNVKQQLELYTPHDSFVEKMEMYRQQPLIVYHDPPIDSDIQHISKQLQTEQEPLGEYYFIRQTYPNGCIYEGYKQNNLREGQGKYIHPNGAFYEGQWHKNMMEGNGKFYNNDFLIYEGEWMNDEYNGEGREYNEDPDNMGIVDYKDLRNIDQIWMTYQGLFKNDKRNGQGILEFVNGGTYTGEFCNGVPDGNGKYSDQKHQIQGRWKEGIYIN